MLIIVFNSRSTTIIKETKDVKITFDGKIARLVISSCTKEVSGSYTVTIKNEFGSNESQATLTVQGTYCLSKTPFVSKLNVSIQI